jgi:hypothetical protein
MFVNIVRPHFLSLFMLIVIGLLDARMHSFLPQQYSRNRGYSSSSNECDLFLVVVVRRRVAIGGGRGDNRGRKKHSGEGVDASQSHE